MNKKSPMVYVPSGKFIFGQKQLQPKSQYDYSMSEKQKTCQAFYIDQHEVTNDEYARFVKATNHLPPIHWNGETPSENIKSLPVVNVSFEDAKKYAIWCGKRLPTEEEWEYAARGNDGRLYPWGNNGPTVNDAIFFRHTNGPMPVGSCPAGRSPFGCDDLAGNVYEWTATAVPETSEYIIRGGDWSNIAENLLSSRRFAAIWDTCSPDLGFRCVADKVPENSQLVNVKGVRDLQAKYTPLPDPIIKRPATGIHPRIFTSPDEREQILSRIKNNPIAKGGWKLICSHYAGRKSGHWKTLKEYLKKADSEKFVPVPDMTILAWLSVYVWITEDAEVADIIKKSLKTMLLSKIPKGKNLFDGFTNLTGAAICYDFAYGLMDNEIKNAFRKQLIASMENTVKKAETSFCGLGRPAFYRAFDWTPLFNVPIGITALALEGEMDENKRAKWEKIAWGAVWDYCQNCIGRDGVDYNGQAYFGFGMWNTGYFLEGLKRRGFNLYNHPHLKKTPDWLTQLVLPWGGVFNSIGKSHQRPSVGNFIVCMNKEYHDNPNMAWYWKNHGGVHPYSALSRLFWGEKPAPVNPEKQIPLTQYFRDGKLVTSRSNWSPDAVYFATRYGREVHCQADTGSFTLYGYGATFAIDGGAYPREFAGHNVILIDGKGAGDDFSSTIGEILAFSDSSLGTVVVGDSTNAYNYYHKFDPGHRVRQNGLTIEKAIRSYFFIKGKATPPYLLITDDIRKDAEKHRYQWLMHTPPGSEFRIDTDMIVMKSGNVETMGRHLPPLPVSPGEKSMTIRILNPTATDITVKEYKKKTTEYKGSHPYLQIMAEAVNPAYRILLIPRKSTTPDPEIKIKRNGKDQLIVLRWPQKVIDYWCFSPNNTFNIDDIKTNASIGFVRTVNGKPTGYAVSNGSYLTFKNKTLCKSGTFKTIIKMVEK